VGAALVKQRAQLGHSSSPWALTPEHWKGIDCANVKLITASASSSSKKTCVGLYGYDGCIVV
jgi:hypothetical protein